MAVVLRKCIICNTEFESKNMRARFCKSTCKSIHHRESKKLVTPTQAILKLKEETTMSNKSQLFLPDPVYLQSLKDNETAFYYLRTQCDIQGKEVAGAMESFEIAGLQSALDRYVQLVGLGYTALPEFPFLPQVIVGPAADYVVLTLKKPAEVIKTELAEIHGRVESEYVNKLEQDKQAAVAREVQFQLDAARRKAQKAAEEQQAVKDAEEYARIEAEVLAALGGK